MRKENCFYLGIIVRKHSYKGEVVIKLDTDEPELYENMESVFVALGNNLVPFFIEKSSLHKGDQLRVKFEGVDTEADAEAIMKAELFLPLELLPELSGNKFYFHEIIDFSVKDTRHGVLGKIKKINDNAAQEILEIETPNQKQILIPLVDDFIVEIDRENKTFVVETPDGLIDLYLEDNHQKDE
ncbi:ribosome maturation factor RimM [Aureivirga marina]|uniref:ribosome maturation factor RimM n=1 Tax=Aureivirga marina TaxID=1182451 RepID=UPI0018CAF947|nr:ribosome maturation factor RimM [Aureivirga marina]